MTYDFGGTKKDLTRRKDPGNAHLYRRWGYPIYRTYYGPGSDESWNTLIELLKQQTMLGLEALEDKDQDDVQKLKELFYLEPHQDPIVFEGLNIHELREYWCNKKWDRSRSRAMADEWSMFSLLADQSVLEDIEKGVFVVKAVYLIWTEHDEHPGFGWMSVPTRYMLELWQQLLIWKHRTEDALCFWGSEEDLHKFIWPGDGTGWCSKGCPVYEKWTE